MFSPQPCDLVRLIEEEVLFPEIDIRQRLTLQSGYGVIEVPVDEAAQLGRRRTLTRKSILPARRSSTPRRSGCPR